MSSLEALFGPKDQDVRVPDAEHRVEQLLALNKAAIAITGELELDALLQRILDVARELVGCKYSALGVLGEDGCIARFPTSGISKTEREKIGAPPRGHGLLGVMLRAGRSLRIPDMSKGPRRVGFPPHHPPMTSLLGVPIFVQGELVGDLYLTDKIGGPEFSEEDEWLVQLLAVHAATALTNSQLHAENMRALELAGRARARSQALLEVTQAVNRSVQLDEVIPLIVQSASDLLGAAGAAVYLLEVNSAEYGVPEDGVPGERSETRGARSNNQEREKHSASGQHFVARYSVGLEESPGFPAQARETTEAARLPIEGSVAGRAVRSGETQVVVDTASEPETVFPRLANKRLCSLVAVPLAAGGQTLGVLSIYSERVSAFDAEAVQLLETFGAIAGVAMRNATLYEQANRGREAAELEQQRLRELEHMKDEFLSTAAHELRTPLTTIHMSAGLAYEQTRRLAQRDEIDMRVVDLLALIVEGSDRMYSLVNDLLDLTRLEQGRATFAIERLDLREVVEVTATSTRPLFESKGQKLIVRLPEVYCAVRGDRQRLEQVVINLLSNAHKYSPPNSSVEVRVIRSGGKCMVTVRDEGPGVPPEERELIFERFYRSTQHRQDRTPSTGLGLPIARKIAEMHKGRVWVEPGPDRGSVFKLEVPAA
jgi:signal transduction histidine kinase